MNTAHGSGAASRMGYFVKRRSFLLLVLVCSLLCFGVGDLLCPPVALASKAKSNSSAKASTARPAVKTTSSKKSSQKTVAKKRRRPLYVKSLMPDSERQALRERGFSSGFGERAISRRATRMHKGIDIPAPKGSKILAFNDGEVIFAGVKNGYGKTVIIRQIDGREALYAHMNEYVVAIGDTVRRGNHIGHVGRTGRATGCHLHFEILDDGENLDPALHVWHGAELVLAPGDLDPSTVQKTQVASPGRRTQVNLY